MFRAGWGTEARRRARENEERARHLAGPAASKRGGDGESSLLLRRLSLSHRPPPPSLRPEHTQVVQDAGYDEDYLVSNVKITLGVMA